MPWTGIDRQANGTQLLRQSASELAMAYRPADRGVSHRWPDSAV